MNKIAFAKIIWKKKKEITLYIYIIYRDKTLTKITIVKINMNEEFSDSTILNEDDVLWINCL